MKLLQLLSDLCMRSFRKEVFLYLKKHSCDVQIIPEYESDAIGGRIALTWPSLKQILEISAKGLCVIWGRNMRIRHIDVLFAWLWDWNDTAEDVTLGRLHWNRKPYRMLFQQCFIQIKKIYGGKEAQSWYSMVKELFIRSHWLLPYPSQKTFFSRSGDGRLQWWCSVHDGLLHYLSSERRYPQNRSCWVLEPWEIRLLPIDGWDKGESPMNIDVNLALIPQNLDALIGERSDHQTDNRSEDDHCDKDLSIRSGLDSAMVYSSGPYCVRRYHLRSYLQQHHRNPKIHENPEWYLAYLGDLLHDVIESRERELHALDPARFSRPWQSRQRAEGQSRAENHTTNAEAANKNNDHSDRRHKIYIELRALRKQQQSVQDHIKAYRTQERSIDHLQKKARHPQTTWTRSQWGEYGKRLQESKKRLGAYRAQLIYLSHRVNRQIRFQETSNFKP
jgi:hypothetical protein